MTVTSSPYIHASAFAISFYVHAASDGAWRTDGAAGAMLMIICTVVLCSEKQAKDEIAKYIHELLEPKSTMARCMLGCDSVTGRIAFCKEIERLFGENQLSQRGEG